MSDITLSAGVRQNLLSLQNTSADLDHHPRTPRHREEGQLGLRQSDQLFHLTIVDQSRQRLERLLDQLAGRANVDSAATSSLIDQLLEQALSTAQQAQQASNDTAAGVTGTADLTSATAAAASSLLISVGATTYTVAVTSGATLANIEAEVNGTTGLGSSGAVTATDDGSGHLVLTANAVGTSFTVGTTTEGTTAGLATTANSATSSTRNTLQTNYNSLLTQIDQLAGDASYNGVNLLAGNNLQVLFNENGTSSLTIAGVNFDSAGLGLSAVATGGIPE